MTPRTIASDSATIADWMRATLLRMLMCGSPGVDYFRISAFFTRSGLKTTPAFEASFTLR